jgi:hypothetical protein
MSIKLSGEIMTNSNKTAIAVLMDRSGSMRLIRTDAEGAVNAFIDKQRELDGECTVRLAQFDTEYEDVYLSTDINNVEDYSLLPRGATALTDGIGKLVVDFGEELAALPEDDRPGTVVVVIVTDGQENASHEYTAKAVKALIEEQKNKYNWDFVFLAAGQDAIATGADYGFSADQSLSFNARNVAATMNMASEYTTSSRLAGVGSYHFSDEEREEAAK